MTEQVAQPVVQEATPVEVAPVAESKPLVEKLKVNGKEIEVSIDELKRAYGLHKAADQKFQEAAKMRKEVEEMKNVFSQKDINALFKAGWTAEEIEEKAAEFIVNQAKQKSMTPQQLEQMKREQEYEELKREKQEREKREKDKIETELREREAKLYQTAFLKEINETNKKTWLDLEDPVILSNVINEITIAAQKYEYDMPVAEAVRILEDRFQKRGPTKKEFLKKLIKSSNIELDDNDLDAFLEKGVRGVREKSAEAFKKSESPFVKQKPQTQSQPTEESHVRDSNYYRNIRLGRAHLNRK